jgi:hypothetical protein
MSDHCVVTVDATRTASCASELDPTAPHIAVSMFSLEQFHAKRGLPHRSRCDIVFGAVDTPASKVYYNTS